MRKGSNYFQSTLSPILKGIGLSVVFSTIRFGIILGQSQR